MKAIIGTDGSACAQIAVDLAAALPWPDGSVLRVVAALDPLSFDGLFVGFAPSVGDAEESLRAALEESVAMAATQLGGEGRTVEHEVAVGRPSMVLRDEAQTFAADLIIVGSRGHSPIANMLLGSVSAEVMDHAPCPVLVARGSKIERIVLAHDGSDNALGAERVVRTWPIFGAAQIDVVSVADAGPAWDGVLATEVGFGPERSGALESESRQHHEGIAAGAARRMSGVGHAAETVVPVGNPAHLIMTIAEQHGADLIVMGTRGNTGLKRLLLGSVARNVLTHAKCSVLVVPPLD